MANGQFSPYQRSPLSQGSRGAPGSSLFDLNRQINRLFESVFDQDGGPPGSGGGLLSPVVEVTQGDGKIEITTELPGVRQEDIDITVEDHTLMIRGEKRSSRSDGELGYSERSYGRFERQIALPPDIDEEACSADFMDGVLTIRLPRSEEKSGRRKIQLGQGGSQKQASISDQEADGGGNGSAGGRKSAGERQPGQSKKASGGEDAHDEQSKRAR